MKHEQFSPAVFLACCPFIFCQLLDPQELGNLFRDLDRSLKPVSPDDVNAVIRQSDLTGRGEIAGINLPKAIAVWSFFFSRFWNLFSKHKSGVRVPGPE